MKKFFFWGGSSAGGKGRICTKKVIPYTRQRDEGTKNGEKTVDSV